MPLAYPAGTLQEHVTCRRGAVAFDVSHLGTVRGRGPRRHGPPPALADQRPAQGGAGAYAVHPSPRRVRRVGGRRHHRVVAGRRGLRRHAQRLQHRAGARRRRRDRHHRRARRDRRARTRGPRPPGGRHGAGGGRASARGHPLHLRRQAVHGGGDRVHRRGRRRMRRAARRGAGVLGRGPRRRHRPGGPRRARDTLRLEAGLPLHGHELGPGITPLQAGLGWVVGWDKPNFRGRAPLQRER